MKQKSRKQAFCLNWSQTEHMFTPVTRGHKPKRLGNTTLSSLTLMILVYALLLAPLTAQFRGLFLSRTSQSFCKASFYFPLSADGVANVTRRSDF